jgi:ribonucleoside-diphosphate reductase alpha chain
VVINKYLVDALDEVGLWNKTVLAKIKIQNGSVLDVDDIPLDLRHRFKETFEIDSEWVLKAAARRAKWIDQSASTNIFLKTTSGRILAETYMNAWEMGLKTTYYLRTLAASQVTKTVELEQQATVPKKEEELVVAAQQFKACSIEDPDCEACQ